MPIKDLAAISIYDVSTERCICCSTGEFAASYLLGVYGLFLCYFHKLQLNKALEKLNDEYRNRENDNNNS